MRFLPNFIFPLALMAYAASFLEANAAITITFSFDGTNTVGVVSGSIILPGTPTAEGLGGGFFPYVGAGPSELYVHLVGTPSYNVYGGGSITTPTGIPSYSRAEFVGTRSFGFANEVLYTAFDAAPGSTYAPTGTFVWANTTLATVGVSGMTSPVTVYTASNGEEIRFVTVPEPGTLSLFAAGTGLIAARIRRRRH